MFDKEVKPKKSTKRLQQRFEYDERKEESIYDILQATWPEMTLSNLMVYLDMCMCVCVAALLCWDYFGCVRCAVRAELNTLLAHKFVFSVFFFLLIFWDYGFWVLRKVLYMRYS